MLPAIVAADALIDGSRRWRRCGVGSGVWLGGRAERRARKVYSLQDGDARLELARAILRLATLQISIFV